MPPKRSCVNRRLGARSWPQRKANLSNVFSPSVLYAEKFIGRRVINGQVQMLIKWINFPVEESTWEPLISCASCMYLYEAYEIEQFMLRGVTEVLLSDFASEPEEPDTWSTSSMSPLRITPDPPRVVFRRKKRAPKKNKKNNRVVDEKYTPVDVLEHPALMMSPYEGIFGLARGLELDKVVHNYRVGDVQIMFVKWKGYGGTDAVPLDELRVFYPEKVLEYFQNMEMRYD